MLPPLFLHERDGDHLHVPFECHLCVFRKLKHRDPSTIIVEDEILMNTIKRMILDAFWSRAESTVAALARNVRMQISMSQQVGLEGPFEQTEPLPLFDHCGYEVAAGMLLYSTRPGKYSKDHLQIDTVRKLRSSYSDFIRASSASNKSTVAMEGAKGNYQRLMSDPCASFWFKRFIEGMRNRIGQLIKPNRALSHPLILRLFKHTEEKAISYLSQEEAHLWLIFLTYITVTYVLSLRGAEGFLLDLKGLNKYWKRGNDQYTIIPLLGKFKGEHQESQHLIPCVSVTQSGIKVRSTLRNLIRAKRALDFTDGPAVSDFRGKLLSSRDLDEMLIESLTHIYLEDQSLFPGDFTSEEHIISKYQCFRTFRRSAATRAIEKKIAKTHMEIVNRWRAVESAAGKRPQLPMHIHYAQVEELKAPFLRFTNDM